MSQLDPRLRVRWLIAALLVVLPLIAYWPVVFGGKVVFWGTPALQFWPWRTFAAQELRAGRMPLWNPYAGAGTPLLANHQSAILYPLNVLFWLLPVERAMGLSLALHAILAGVTMYALARDLGLTRIGSVVAALAFMFSGYMVARGAFLTEVSALPWLPLLWLYGRRLVRRRRLSDLVLLSGAIAVQFLAGHAQTWFYSLVSLALYGLWEGGRAAQEQAAEERSPVWEWVWRWAVRCAPLGLAVIWGVALSAAQFLPTLELSRLAGRAGRSGWEAFALQYSFWPWRLITLLLPDFFGHPARGNYWGYATYWEDAGYIGVLPFVFALLAIVAWARWRRAQDAPRALGSVPPFALLVAFALLMALGKNTPFYMVFFRHVPGFDTFQAPARWLCIYTPAIALLSGIGIDALRPSHRLTFVCRLAAAGAVGIAGTTLAAKAFLPAVEVTFFDPLVQFAVLLAATMVLLLWGQVIREGRAPVLGKLQAGAGLWQGVVVLVVAADLVVAGYLFNPAIDPAFYEPETDTGAFLNADGPQGRTYYLSGPRDDVMWGRYLDFADYGPTDVAHWRGMREALLPDMGMVERLPSANTFEPLVEARLYTLLEAIEAMPRETALRVLGTMNVAYLFDPAPNPGLDLAYDAGSVGVYRNPYLLPRAYVVCRAQVVASPEEALAALASPDFDPLQTAILEHPAQTGAGAGSPQGASCGSSQAMLLPSPSNQATIRAVLSQPGYLVLADTFYPGWVAYVDDQRVETLRANYAFRAVALGAGEHEVGFQYRPQSFVAGLACSTFALVGLFVAWGASTAPVQNGPAKDADEV